MNYSFFNPPLPGARIEDGQEAMDQAVAEMTIRLQENRYAARQTCRYICDHKPLIIDTETSGLDNHSEVIDLAIIEGATGEIIFNNLLYPRFPIQSGAAKVHGITNEMINQVPKPFPFAFYWKDIRALIEGRLIVAYNTQFDLRMIEQTALIQHLDPTLPWLASFDLMQITAAALGSVYDCKSKTYKWIKLTEAAARLDIDITDAEAHRAAGDCKITKRLLYKLAES